MKLPYPARVLFGFGLCAGCFLAGEALRGALGLFVPGAMIGLFLLLALLAARIVRMEWVEDASALLLTLIPLWLLPLFVWALRDLEFWKRHGLIYGGLAALGWLLGLLFVGRVSQVLFARQPGGAEDPGPLTDEEQREIRENAAAMRAAE